MSVIQVLKKNLEVEAKFPRLSKITADSTYTG
jgi:hypothetical protein